MSFYPTCEYEYMDRTFKLEKTSKGYRILDMRGSVSGDELIIPSHYEGTPIYSIGIRAFINFQGCRAFIPKTIETIEFCAFGFLKDLEQVDFEDESELKTIGEKAFAGSGLKSVIIPKSVTLISPYAFDGCALQSLIFENGSNLNKIGFAAFRSANFESVTLNISNAIIESESFANNPNLKTVNLQYSDDLKFRHNVFNYCPNLKTIVPPTYGITYYIDTFPSVDFAKVIQSSFLFK